ncbi:MAG: hypothetical protein JWO85_3443 [Candidatus Eremiobacteraeota bacterium]|nr:hypothetical protein [Candidatus Eremiobacteraeota bacterium]
MAYPLSFGFSAFVDPADLPYLRLLEHCARARRDLGLPSLTRAELEALLERRVRAPRGAFPPNVVPLRDRRRQAAGDEGA